MQKQFVNGADEVIAGYDTGSAALGLRTPIVLPWSMIRIREEPDWYPNGYRLKKGIARYLDVSLASYNIQIAIMTMKNMTEIYETPDRPVPALGSILRDQGEIKYLERSHTIVAPMHRQDMYVTWNFRRAREGQKDYRGGFIWREGEIRFKNHVTLQGKIPIPLVTMRCPYDPNQSLGDIAIVTDSKLGTRVFLLRERNQTLRTSGRLKPGGYATQMPTVVGYNGFLSPNDMDFAYESIHKGWPGSFRIGLGRDGQKVSVGTVMKYRYAIGTFANPNGGNDLQEHTIRAMNFDGGTSGYPIEIKVGRLTDTTFFFTANAVNNEALFKLGPQDLIIDLPIKVVGVNDNGCCAVYSTKRKWLRFIPVLNGTAIFQEPIEDANEMWVGNIFVADTKALKITAVIDRQAPGRHPFVEVDNPTNEEVATVLCSPHTPRCSGVSAGRSKSPQAQAFASSTSRSHRPSANTFFHLTR